MGSKIQNEDVKSEADLLAKSGTKDQLIHDTKIYVTAEGLNKRLDEAITDGDIGGGGVGGINHILDQSEDATLWTNDVNFTITDNTTNPLRGDQDLLIEKAGVDASGEVVSVPFTIDDADKGKKLPLSFDYKNSGTYQDGDYEIEIYDVSSAIVVSNTNPSIISQDNFTASHVTYWDANFASTSYELRVKCITADTNTSSMQVDNLQTGPVNCKAGGSFISDWIDFTPTGTWTTNTTYTGKYRRVGGSAEIRYQLNLSGAPNAVTLEFDKPAGLSVDAGKLLFNNDQASVGFGQVIDLGSNRKDLRVQYRTGTDKFVVQAKVANTTYSQLAGVTNLVPQTFASGDGITIIISVPIQGWGTGVKPAEVVSGRLHAMSVSIGSSQSFTNGTLEKVTSWGTPDFDFSSAWDSVNNEYVVPESGLYQVNSTIGFFDSGSDMRRVIVEIVINGSPIVGADNMTVNTTTDVQTIVTMANRLLNLQKGDTIGINAYQLNVSANSLTPIADPRNYLTIHKLNNLNAQLLPDDTASNINAVIISDWESFTPTGTLVTNTTYEGSYRRVGNQLEVTGSMLFSGTAPSGVVEINLPAGLSIDENALKNQSGETFDKNIGHAQIRDTSAQAYACRVAAISSTSVRIQQMRIDTGGDFTRVTSVEFGGGAPIVAGAGDSIFFNYTVPIQGWETGIKPTEVVSGREIHAQASFKTSTSFASGALTYAEFDTFQEDTTASGSIVNNEYIVPESGLYNLQLYIQCSSGSNNDGGRIAIYYNLNGANVLMNVIASNTIGGYAFFVGEGSRTVRFQKGDVLKIRLEQNSGASATLTSNTRFFITRNNNLSAQIQPTETVAAKYKDTSGQLLTGTGSVISYPTKVHDTHNMMNGSFDTFIIPVSGLYLVSGSIGTAGGTPFAADANVQLRAVKNGIDITRSFTRTRASSTSYMVETLAQEYFTAGDTLQLYYYGSVNTNADTTDFRNYTAITKIGN